MAFWLKTLGNISRNCREVNFRVHSAAFRFQDCGLKLFRLGGLGSGTRDNDSKVMRVLALVVQEVQGLSLGLGLR